MPWSASFIVGALVATQSRINGEMALAMGSSVDAATVSQVIALTLIATYLTATPAGRRGLRALAAALRERRLVPWQLAGGLMGAYAVWAQSYAVPLVGVALFSIAIVAGQTSNSLVVDRAGLGAAGKIPLTRSRLAAAVLGLAAVVVAVTPRLSAESVAFLALGISLSAGLLIAVQHAINGKVSRATDSSLTATGVNFAIGTLGLGAAVAVVAFLGEPFHFSELPTEPHLYTAGIIGVAVVAGTAWVVPILGVLRFALVSIAGQLSGALLWDVVAPTAGAIVSIHLIVGLLMAFAAVVVSARR